VQTAAPGLFMNGAAAIVQNSDFTLNDATHPVAAGGTIVAYLTGSGAGFSGGRRRRATPLSPLRRSPLSKFRPRIGSADAKVSFAGLTATFIGLVQLILWCRGHPRRERIR